MNPIKSLLHAALWIFVTLFLFTGCDSVEVNNETPINPGPVIEIPLPDFIASASFSFEVPLAEHVQLRLKAYNGIIKIKCLADATSVTVTGERRVGSDSMQDAEKHLDDLEVRVDNRADEVYIHTVQPQENKEGRQYAVDYTITIPQDLAVVVNHINGLVRVDDLYESASVTLVNGNIEGNITLPLNERIELTTINGDINLTIPVSTSAGFSASVSFGSISLSNLNLKSRTSSSQSIRGTLGDGEGTITLKTAIGDIKVSGQQ